MNFPECKTLACCFGQNRNQFLIGKSKKTTFVYDGATHTILEQSAARLHGEPETEEDLLNERKYTAEKVPDDVEKSTNYVGPAVPKPELKEKNALIQLEGPRRPSEKKTHIVRRAASKKFPFASVEYHDAYSRVGADLARDARVADLQREKEKAESHLRNLKGLSLSKSLIG